MIYKNILILSVKSFIIRLSKEEADDAKINYNNKR